MLMKINQACRKVSRVAVWASGSLMLCCAILVSIDVIARKFFGLTISGSDELSSYAFAISTAWAFSFAFLDRSHIRIDAFYNLLPRKVSAALDVVSVLTFLGYVGLLTVESVTVVQTTWSMDAHSNTPMQTPLIIPQGLWLAGLVGFFLVIVLATLQAIPAFFAGDMAKVRRVAGIKTQDEEIATEVAELKMTRTTLGGVASHERQSDDVY
jgi:TRAP-type C4-dicarboxylate transport system permease small subunit